MGIATLRARAKDNRSLISRFFVTALFVAIALAGPLLPTAIASAASEIPGSTKFDWVSEARIKASGPAFSALDFVDSNAYDSKRQFRAGSNKQLDALYRNCTNTGENGIYWIIPTSATAGTLFELERQDKKGACKTVSKTIQLGSSQNALTQALPCPYTGSNAEERCAERYSKSNAAWIQLIQNCTGFIGPVAPGSPCSTIPPPTDSNQEENTSEPEKDECSALGEFSAKWIACPLLTASLRATQFLDTKIEEYLHYDTKIFDRSTDKGKNFYNAWSTFRGIALALVLIAGLVMVVSQGTGMQIFDTYTVKKVMPRLLVAVIGITLSWQILQFVITFFNDTGHWVQDIILMPFQGAAQSTGNKGIAEGLGAATIIVTAFTGGATYLIGLGWAGSFALVGTVFLAYMVAVIVLIIRSVIITMAILAAPLAIACYILPNTKKVWDFWQNAITTALTIFPIIMALLAAGKALALVTDEGLMKVLFVVAPYFFLPFAFKLAGGLMSTVFSITNDRGRGAFDRLRNVRQNALKTRSERWRDGRLFKQGGMFDKGGLNTAGLATGAFMRAERKGEMLNPFAPKRSLATLRQGMTTQQRIAAMKQAGTDEAKVTQHDDDQQRAQMFESEAAARTGLARYYNYNPEQIEKAIAAAKANGGFSKAIQLKAFESAAASGTALKNWDDALSIGSHIAGDNEQFRGQVAAMLKQRSVQAGRVDFGASIGDIYSALGDVTDKAKAGQRSHFLNGQELTVKAALGQDATSVLRGKNGAVQNISKAVNAEIKDLNVEALKGNPEAQQRLAELSATVASYGQNIPYSSMENTLTFRNEMQLPTKEIRENVKRASQPVVEERTPLRDINTGEHVRDTAGNRVYETVTETKTVRVPLPGGGEDVREVDVPKRTQSIPDRRTGEFGYRNDVTNPHNMSNTYQDLMQLRQPYGDPQDRRNPNNEIKE